MNTERYSNIFLMIFLALVVFGSCADIAADLSEGSSTSHIVQESLVLVCAIAALLWLSYAFVRTQHTLAGLRQTLDDIRTMPQPESPLVADARHKLGEAILEQFRQWQLSQSEKEVGLLLLKGYSLQEISALRGTAEKTVRQQASTIYQKSGLAGRHVLSAWFIEDLL